MMRAVWSLKSAWAGCKEQESDVQCKYVEARQSLNVLRLPVATYLHTIDLTKHFLFCTQCGQGSSHMETWSLSHCFRTCRKFHHAVTAAHNQVSKVPAASLHKHSSLAALWSLYQGSPLSKTGLVLTFVSSANCTAFREASLRSRRCSITNESWKITTWSHSNILLTKRKLLSGERYVCTLIFAKKNWLRATWGLW